MIADQEKNDFSNWASLLFPEYSTNSEINALAETEWEIEKRVRALEEEGMTRGDAQGVVEAENLSALMRPKSLP